MTTRLVGRGLVLALGLLLLACAAPATENTRPTTPFGPAESRPAVPQSGTRGPASAGNVGLFDRSWQWLLATQAEFSRQLASAVRELKTADPRGGILVLAGLSFAYGVLHAAGPGHGKAVISSYALADGRTLRRGVLLSFLAAAIQALSAIAMVALLLLVVQATGIQLRDAEASLETASWGLVAMVGGWTLYRQLAPLMRSAWHRRRHMPVEGESAGCGDCDLPAVAALEAAGSWRRAMALAFAVGVRPCSGAILVLVFAVGQGLLWAGVFSTFVMALGTAITVSALAAFAIGARGLAARFATFGSTTWVDRVYRAAALGGAGLVLVLGATLFVVSLRSSRPL
ncbi:MAG: nickel/cobalt transporter [Chloroflexota bacterium]